MSLLPSLAVGVFDSEFVCVSDCDCVCVYKSVCLYLCLIVGVGVFRCDCQSV